MMEASAVDSVGGLPAAKANFRQANLSLQNSLSRTGNSRLKSVTFPDFSQIVSVESLASDVEDVLEKLIGSRIVTEHSNNRIQTAKEIIRNWFRASYPFIQVFLTIGAGSSAVMSSY